MIKLYTKKNIHLVEWSHKNDYQRDYLTSIIINSCENYFTNVQSEVCLLQLNDSFIPITINDKEYDNCYVCSPYTTYVTYLLEELIHICSKPLRNLLTLLIKLHGKFLKLTRINKIVFVNNWMLSTNLYDAHLQHFVPEITHFLIQNFPDQAIGFRSLNKMTNDELIINLKKNQYIKIPSRIVYISDCRTHLYLNSRDIKKDLRQLRNTSFKIIDHDDITPLDYPRIIMLYNELYLKKYSYQNVQFTISFIELCHQKKLLIMKGLRNQKGILVGIIGSFVRHNVLTTPLLGYDLTLPKKEGVYRLLSAMIQELSAEHHAICNNSAGAGNFKKLRGASPTIEYTMLYTKHLRWWRKLPWYILKVLLAMAVPFVKKREL